MPRFPTALRDLYGRNNNFTFRVYRLRIAAAIALNIVPIFYNLTIEDDLECLEEALPTVLFDMPHAIDISATDGYFDPDHLERLNDSRPEAEAMREACASGDLTAVQSVFKTHWLDQPVDEGIDKNELGASGLCEAIRQDDANIARYLLSNVISMQPVHFAMAAEYHAYSILQLYMDSKWDINTYLSRMQSPALS